jgi:hypothetical protein
MLEVLYAANLNSYEGGLNLTNSKNLREVDARGSSFGAIEFADNAPIRIIKLNNPSSLSLSNTKYLENLSIANFGRLSVLKLHNVDNNNISTLDLVNNAYALTNYRLTNVNWNLNSASSIDENKINVLEKLLSKKPIDDP